MNQTNAIEALKSFIDDNEDLERLESMLDRFNLFESLGLIRQEIRHSAFLRWLLDPTETHGLGDYWLRQFLRKVIKNGEGILDNAPSLFDLDDWSLGRAEVRKEWRNIDVFVIDEANQFVCAIENKVDSSQAKEQLQRYWEIVEREFEEYKKVYVFLTISGEDPRHDAYVSVSYEDIANVIGSTLKRRESQLNHEIKLFIQQYLDMVRRHIMEDSEVQKLCRRIYQNHHRALDLIFDHRPDRAAEVGRNIQAYVRDRQDLILTSNSRTYINFLPKSMDFPQRQDDNKTPILVCQILNKGNQVRFKLELGPGPKLTREQIYEKAKSLPQVFGKAKAKLSPKYHTFYSETWIYRRDYDELGDEEIRQLINEQIKRFTERKGSGIANALKGLPSQ